MKFFKLITILISTSVISFFTSCDKDDPAHDHSVDGCTDVLALNFDSLATEDDGSCEYNQSNAPVSYNFSNASYDGQIDRLNMLKELETYLKTVNDGAVIDASLAKSMYANDGYTWTSDAFANAQPTKQLKNKTFESEQSNVEALIDELAELSVNGTLTGGYMFNANGFEPVQLIVKGIMGSCFYYQGTSVYLSEAKMNVDNDVSALTTDLEFTDMQHHFDESFGYLGAPIDMSIAIPDGGFYWGKYAKKTLVGSLTTIDNLMQDGFISGRHAINNMDYDARDQAIAIIQTEWEMIPVASALYYLNSAEAAIADDAVRNHALSEAVAFMSALKWNSNALVTSSQVDEMIAMLGDNLFNITALMISDTRNALASAYGISNPTEF